MPKQNTFKGISGRALALLSSGEGKDVDYKELIKGLHAEDLVAFANSKEGGTILVGVREVKGKDGRQRGEPVGHPIDDDSKLQIVSKALSCSPPVQVDVFIENLDHIPFYRLEIPSGSQKPYATSSGTYKIREDARNMPLLPEALLKMFLEREGEEFRLRFSEATGKLASSMSATLSVVEQLENSITEKVEEIGNTLGWADFKVGETTDAIDKVQGIVLTLLNESRKQGRRTKAIAIHLAVADPVKQDAEKELLDSFAKRLREEPELYEAAVSGSELKVSLSGEHAQEFEKSDFSRILSKAIDLIKAERETASSQASKEPPKK